MKNSLLGFQLATPRASAEWSESLKLSAPPKFNIGSVPGVKYNALLEREQLGESLRDKFFAYFYEVNSSGKSRQTARERFSWWSKLTAREPVVAWNGRGYSDLPHHGRHVILHGSAPGYDYKGLICASQHLEPAHQLSPAVSYFGGSFRLQREFAAGKEILRRGKVMGGFYTHVLPSSTPLFEENMMLRVIGRKSEHILAGVVQYDRNIYKDMTEAEHLLQRSRIVHLCLQRILTAQGQIKKLVNAAIIPGTFLKISGKPFASGLAIAAMAGASYLACKFLQPEKHEELA